MVHAREGEFHYNTAKAAAGRYSPSENALQAADFTRHATRRMVDWICVCCSCKTFRLIRGLQVHTCGLFFCAQGRGKDTK